MRELKTALRRHAKELPMRTPRQTAMAIFPGATAVDATLPFLFASRD